MKSFAKFYLLVCLVLLMGCQTETSELAETAVATEEIAAVTDTPAASPTTPPTETAVPPTATATQTAAPTETAVPPTNTPAALATQAKPTSTPRPTTAASPTSKPSPTSEPLPTAEPLDEDSQLDAMQLIINSESRTRSLNTVQFIQNIIVTVTGFEQNITQHCQSQLPDLVYCRTDTIITFGDNPPIETYNETAQQGDQIWISEEGGEWINVTEEFNQSETLSQEGLAQLTMSEFIEGAEVIGQTIIDGVPVYEIAFTLNVNAYFSHILGEETAALFTAAGQDNSGNGRMWVGQQDMLPRKSFIQMSILIEGEEINVTTQSTSFGFNEPVTIIDPTAD